MHEQQNSRMRIFLSLFRSNKEILERKMGSKDDEYFLKRYEEGKNDVFFGINSPTDAPWIESFVRVVRELGLRPVFYSGASRSVLPEAGNSNTMNDELCDDFYPAKTKVLYFGKPKDGTGYEDHWVLGNLKKVNSEHKLLVYVSPDYPVEVLRRYGFEGDPIAVTSPAQFEQSLRQEIKP